MSPILLYIILPKLVALTAAYALGALTRDEIIAAGRALRRLIAGKV